MAVLRASASGLVLPGNPRPDNPQSFVATRGLVAYWPLSTDSVDLTNSRIKDLYPTRASIADTAAAFSGGKWQNGQVGLAYAITGSQGAACVVSPAVTVSANFTIACWLYIAVLPSGGVWNTLFTVGTANGFYIKNQGGSTLLTYFSSGDHFSNTALISGQWYHVAVTVSGSGPANFYLNGAPNFTAGTNITSSDALSAIGWSTSQALNGAIQEMRVHNVPLTASEILDIYQAGLAGRRDDVTPAGGFLPDELMAVAVSATGNVTLTGVAGTAAVGPFTPGVSLSLTGVSGTAAVGSPAETTSHQLAGVVGIAAVGSFVPNVSRSLTGVASTAALGLFTPSVSVSLTGVAGLAALGALMAAGGGNVSLTGVTAVCQLGAFAANDNISLTGAAAVAALGAFVASISVPLSGVSGLGQVGVFSFAGGTNVALPAVSGIAAVGALTPSVQISLTGVVGVGVIASFVGKSSVPLSGVAGIGQVGFFSLPGNDNVAMTGVVGYGVVGMLSIGTVAHAIDPRRVILASFRRVAVLSQRCNAVLSQLRKTSNNSR